MNTTKSFTQIFSRYTQMHADENKLNELPGRVIGCAFTVLNALGVGFLEKLYENAPAHELRKIVPAVAQQRGVAVGYDGTVVGDYCVGLLVEQALLIELKTVKALDEAHCAQCLSYLKAARPAALLLLNFRKSRLEIKRVANCL